MKVRFIPDLKEVEGRPGETILELAREAGVEIAGPCGGKASCGRCLVKILQGAESLNPPSDDEKVTLGGRRLAEGYRLACRCSVLGPGNLAIYVPPESRASEHVLLAEGYAVEEATDPPLRRIGVHLPEKVKEQSSSLIESLGLKSLVFDAAALRGLSRIVGGAEKEAYMTVYDDEVLDVSEREHGVLGFALDVGTTKLAGYLVELDTGRILATVAQINPQVAYGEDVVSRITYALQRGVEELRRKVVSGINSMMGRACEIAESSPDEVYEVVAVGNTVMHHILLGLELKTLSLAPYTPVTRGPLVVRASDYGLHVNPGARLYLPPLIAGYVGSDVLADMLATGIHREGDGCVLIDMGTNTEVVVGVGGRFYACSTASGPAFEGAHIKFGMRAARGAIDRVEVVSADEVRYTVIGGGKPVGLTGSAVIDAIAGLLDVGLMDRTGKLGGPGSGRLRRGEDGYLEFVVAYGEETATGSDIVLTQRDVREIQLAKAAIRAGINILMRKAGLREDDPEKVYVAGAFGFFLNPSSAVRIGLFPGFRPEAVRLVGNTAAAGARALLLSRRLRQEAEELVGRVEYVELAAERNFQSEFISSIHFPDVKRT